MAFVAFTTFFVMSLFRLSRGANDGTQTLELKIMSLEFYHCATEGQFHQHFWCQSRATFDSIIFNHFDGILMATALCNFTPKFGTR
jgi:hypothetical protein